MTSWIQDQKVLEELRQQRADAELKLAQAVSALHLIAAPKRPDGTYNRGREACEQLARQTLEEIAEVDHDY
jgi:hypothetical protein